MPTFSPSGGVDETEPTLIADDSVQDCTGAEYRVGEAGIFVARGRDLTGTISGVTCRGLYEAGFDGVSQYVIAHEGNSIHAAFITATGLSFSLVNNIGAGSLPIVGTHYANRHYLATGVSNMRMEGNTAQGVTFFPIGMSTAGLIAGVSVSPFTGPYTAVTGLAYWVTEYDSVRGIESIRGATAHTGAFTTKLGVTVSVTGTQSNANADKLRLYRSVDGGGFPDGGLIREVAIGTTQIADTNLTNMSTLTVPQYGIISIGGLDTDRDERPPAMSVIFGPFQDSLLGATVDEPRVLRFTPAGYPDSWPAAYGIPLETHRRDQILTGVVLPGRIGVFCNDSVHVIHRLPRDSDSIFASGEAQEVLTDARGCVSRRGATVFTPVGSAGLAAWVARDGIWVSNLVSAPASLTDKIRWKDRVDVDQLSSCRLLDDPDGRRLIFLHRRATDTTRNTGIWYIDYQHLAERGIRITFADHGPLADAVTIAASDGVRRVLSCDSRSNGQVYLESTQDVDDSQLVNASGAVTFSMRSKEFMPAGPRGSVALGKATWMHDAGPERIEHRFWFNRRDDNPEVKPMPDTATRNASDVSLQRSVNSASVGIASSGTVSYGVHWIDIEGLDAGPSGGRKGA